MDVHVGRYRLVRLLARGGMAEVFHAQTDGPGGFQKDVAVKRVLPHLSDNAELTGLFLDEARLAAKLAHPNVVQVFDFGESDGAQFLAMELLEGVDLARVIRFSRQTGEPLPLDVLAYVAAESAAGLHYAHCLRDDGGAPLKLVHRDVSPSNLFLTTYGAVKVLDFGIAKAEGQLHHSSAGTLKGKHAYVPPEQIADADLGPAADVWSLGATLYEACTGVRLFERRNMMATLLAILDERIPPPRELRSDMNEGLEAVILRCLERELSRRYAGADDVRADLKGAFAATIGPDDVAALVRRVREQPLEEAKRPVTAHPLIHSTDEEAVESLDVSVEIRPPTPATPLAWQAEKRARAEGTRVLGNYALEGALRADAVGVLHRARSLHDDKLALVLVLHTPPSDALSWRLAAAVAAQRELVHENVLRVVASGSDDDVAWAASEPVDAKPLADLLEDAGRLPAALVTLLAADALRGLAAAHDRQLCFGPITTTNLIVTTDGEVKLFGVGLALDDDHASPARDLAGCGAALVTALAGEGEGPPLARAPASPLLLDAVLERLRSRRDDDDGVCARRALVELTPLLEAVEGRYPDVLRSFAMEPSGVRRMLDRSQAQLELARARHLLQRQPSGAQAAVSLLRAKALDPQEPNVRKALEDLAQRHGWALDAELPEDRRRLVRAVYDDPCDGAALKHLYEACRDEGRWLHAFVWLARYVRSAPHDDDARGDLMALAGEDPKAPFGPLPSLMTMEPSSPVPSSSSQSRSRDPLTPSVPTRAPVRLPGTLRALSAADLPRIPASRSRVSRWLAAAGAVVVVTAGGLVLYSQSHRQAVVVSRSAARPAAEGSSSLQGAASDREQLSLGLRALDESRYHDAVKLLHDVIARNATEAIAIEARFARAHANVERGNLDDASADYRELLRLVPRSNGDHARALRLLELVERKKQRTRER